MGLQRTATRDTFGRVSLTSSIHLPGSSSFWVANPVAFPPGRAHDKGERYRVGDDRHHDGDRGRRLLGSQGGLAGRDDDVHLEADQLGGEVWEPFDSSLRPPVLDGYVSPFDIAELAESLLERFDKGIGVEVR